MLLYDHKKDHCILLNADHGICEVVSHGTLDLWSSWREEQKEPTFYELVEMYPEAIPLIKQNLIRNIKLGIDVAQSRVRLNFFNPYKINYGINEQDIQQARSVPLTDILGRVPHSRKILCLFHNDKTASMHVYKNSYYCFSCGAHGSTIDVVMKLHGKTFKEAVNFLINKSG